MTKVVFSFSSIQATQPTLIPVSNQVIGQRNENFEREAFVGDPLYEVHDAMRYRAHYGDESRAVWLFSRFGASDICNGHEADDEIESFVEVQ